MKKIIFGLLMTMGMLNAQNNLVFNRVLEMAITATNTATVPEGKVWKVESSSQALYVDKPNVDYGIPIGSQPFSTGSGAILWLSENSTISVSSGVGKVSILEFDVVPVSTTSTGSGGLSSEGLEFNQVINYSNNIIVSGTGEIIDTIVVPEGKVWKLTRVTLTKAYSPTSNYVYEPEDSSNAAIYLGGILIFYRPPTSGYSTSSYNSYPIWINSGTKELAVGDNDTNNTRFLVTFTGIEYNIPQ